MLRTYQQTFVDDIRAALREHKRVIACAATGGGKTHVFMHIIEAALHLQRTVLVLTEDRRIFSQAEAHRDFHLINAGIKEFYIKQGHAYLAMAQTLSRRPKMIENFKFFSSNLLVISDEAHIGTMTGILQQLPDAFVIGFTATPDYRIAKHLPDIYKACVVGPQPDQLIQENFLTPYKHYIRTKAKPDFSQLVIGSDGDYTEASQEVVFNAEKLYDALAEDLRSFQYYKGSIYCASIKQAETTMRELQQRGFDITTYHSKAPEYNLQQFIKGKISLITSVGSLTKGWDHPPVDLIVFYMKTKSLAKYLQVCGRGSRLWNETVKGFNSLEHAPKEVWNVLDFGGNGFEHGLWDTERDWQNMWFRKPYSGSGVAAVKLCPQCDRMLYVSIMKCPECGYEFDRHMEDPGETVLVEITAHYSQLVGKRISQLTAPELAEYAKHKNKANFAMRVAKSRSIKDEQFLIDYAEAMDYKQSWVFMQRRLIHDAIAKAENKDNPIPYTDFILR